MKQKKAVVCGAGGFIGSHLVEHLKKEGFWVRGVDLKSPLFAPSPADEFLLYDLRDFNLCKMAIDQPVDEVYQLAADMGGAGYLFTGENDANVMCNSALINLNVLRACTLNHVKRVFYSSSACVYPIDNQIDASKINCSEDSVYPAMPDSEYGWEKLFSERLYSSFSRNYKIQVRIARYHNIFGPQGAWNDGREKAPAALCRKIAEQAANGEIEIWGDGEQCRSFLYIDECIEGTIRLMRSSWTGPVNIGSEELVSINELAHRIMQIADKKLNIKHISGPIGVNARVSDNCLIYKMLGWKPQKPLIEGLQKTYAWIEDQVKLSAAGLNIIVNDVQTSDG